MPLKAPKIRLIHVYQLGFLVLTAIIFIWRYRVGMNRFLDADEFTHLNWAAQVAWGKHLYIDFFTFFTPFFYWVFSLLFRFYPRDPQVFLAGRVLAFVIFALLSITVFWLYRILRPANKQYALLPVILFAWLPMPLDKTIEIRPDNLALLFGILGMIAQMFGFRGKTWRGIHLSFFAGILYGLMMMTLVKMAPIVLVGVIMTFVMGNGWKSFYDLVGRRNVSMVLKSELALFAGGAVVFVFLFLWMLSLGNFPLVWYSLTSMAFEANKFSIVMIMEPHLFFFPNGSFYGAVNAPTMSLYLNNAMWTIGLLTGVIYLFTPFRTQGGIRHMVRSELLVSLSFMLFVILYVTYYPLKHSQYLIPIAIFFVLYVSDVIVWALRATQKYVGKLASVMTLIILGFFLYRTTVQANEFKIYWNNAYQLDRMNRFLAMIPADARVFDLEGTMLWWESGYYICCLPFGLYIDNLSFDIPDLHAVLERDKVEYIYQGDSRRLYHLNQTELLYIRNNYEPVEGFGETFWKRKSV